MPDISVPALNTNTIRTHLVRILHLRYKTACFPWKNEGSGTTLATHWTTHQGPRQRTRRRSTCRHGHAWIGRKAKVIGQKCEKPWGNQGFLAERTGTELLAVFPMILKSSKGTKLVSSETTPFVTDCMRSRLDPRRTKHVAPAFICGHPGTFGNLRLRIRSLTLSRHDSRLQTEILWRTCTVIPGESHGFRLPLEDQQGRLQSY